MVQAERLDADPWEAGIRYFLIGKETTSIDHILESHLSKPPKDWTRSDKIRIAQCLKSLGWERYRLREGSKLSWAYRDLAD